MATNTGKGSRIGPVKKRVQEYNPTTNSWDKFDTETGIKLGSKKNEPFVGVPKAKDDRLRN